MLDAMDARPAAAKSAKDRPDHAEDGASIHWRRNLWVCLFGSFTTIVSMTLLIPFLPLYVEELGVHDHAAIVQWSGAAYGATFFTAALVAPLWGHIADRYGRKVMLIRASFGMTVAMPLLGFADNVWQLLALRLLVGLLGGYSSASIALVATQTPRARTAWALGALASGSMAGNIVGPLVGGALPPLIGIRWTFMLSGAVIFLTFLASVFLVREEAHLRPAATAEARKARGSIRAALTRPVLAMLVTGTMVMFAALSIEPIITVYVGQITPDPARVTMMAGLVMSATALGSILSAPRLGRLADRIGHWSVVVASLGAAAIIVFPQAFVTSAWQLVGLRFLMGLALGGLMPCVTAVIRHNAPADRVGGVLGLATSTQYAGQVLGPLAGGFVGGHYGMRAVFFTTGVTLAAVGIFNQIARRRLSRSLGDGP